ncbi:MAG: MerR family DNA-binding protein [Streptosporangiales bacterium]|nr:MerR family DNA-binding protein [Streptosporangiales bacterium]
MRSGEVAGKAGVNVQTLRYYERRGLLAEPPRSAAGYRAYPAGAVEVVRFVKRAQQLGFTLDEVEELLGMTDGGPASCDAARTVAEQRLADLEAKIADLQRMRASLRRLVATCSRPRRDRECPLLQAVGTNAEGS